MINLSAAVWNNLELGDELKMRCTLSQSQDEYTVYDCHGFCMHEFPMITLECIKPPNDSFVARDRADIDLCTFPPPFPSANSLLVLVIPTCKNKLKPLIEKSVLWQNATKYTATNRSAETLLFLLNSL